MTYSIRRFSGQDTHALIDIFNYHIEQGFAAFPEERVPHYFFRMLEEVALPDTLQVIEAEDTAIVGFGLLKKYQAFDVVIMQKFI